MQAAGDHDLSQLTDRDVEILYDIIKEAERKTQLDPTRPFGPALFEAYDRTLAREGIDNGNGHKYFLFILHFFQGNVPGDTPIQKFINILASCGITVDISEDEEEKNEDIARQGEPLDVSHPPDTNGASRHVLRPSRAASVSDIDERPSQPDSNSIDHRSSRTRGKRRTHSEERRRAPLPTQADRGRVKHRSASETFTQRRQRSVSSNASVRIQRSGLATSGPSQATSDDDTMYSGATISGHSFADVVGQLNAAGQYQTLRSQFRPPETELLAMADTFAYSKAVIAQRRLFRKWKERAEARKARNKELANVADNHRRVVLASNLMNKWRRKRSLEQESLEEQEQELERHQLLELYDQQLDAARRERLLQKALTHWDQECRDQRQLTRVARRHVIRFKTFNGWRAVTAINGFKLRRFILGKFFSRWRRRTAKVQHMEIQGGTIYLDKLMARGYWSFYFAVLEQMAEQKEKTRTLLRTLHQWATWFREERRDIKEFRLICDRRAARRALEKWAVRSHGYTLQEDQARNFNTKIILTRFFGVWKIATLQKSRLELATRATQLALVRMCLSRWQRCAADSQKAANFRRVHLLRSTIKSLRYAHRCRVLSSDTQEWQKAEKFYKWRLVTRAVQGVRLFENRLKARFLALWADKALEQRAVLEELAGYYAATQIRVRLLSALRRIVNVLHQHELDEERASSFRSKRLRASAFSKWIDRTDHVQHMNAQAEAAQFYIFAKKAIRQWREQTDQHQRVRRREAYAQIRRMVKMNVCRDMLHRMHDAVVRIKGMEREAQDRFEDKAIGSAITKLSNWRYKAHIMMAQNEKASSFYRLRITGKAFHKLLNQYNDIARLNEAATSFHNSAVEREASNCFKKLDRRLFQIKGQDQWAIALRERHLDKRARIILRYWAERAMAARHGKHADVVLDDDAEGEEAGDNPDDAAGLTIAGQSRAVDVSNLIDLDELDSIPLPLGITKGNNQGVATSTPLPAYLRTPSKRSTARAKARERLVAFGTSTLITGMTPAAGRRVGPLHPPATAPPGPFSTSSAFPTGFGGGGITSFERKLQAQGYQPQRTGRSTPAKMAAIGGAVQTAGFGVFEDITENDDS